MMATVAKLIAYLNQLLKPELYQDYCPNGLQVATKNDQVKRLVTGVSANQALIAAAVKAEADLLLVHHGFFWRGENPCLLGIHYQRIAQLIESGMGLVCYHLPLDGHDKFGNNVQLAKVLELNMTGEFVVPLGPGIGRTGRLLTPMSGNLFAKQISVKLERMPFYIPGKSAMIHTLAWCSGAAQDFIFAAAEAGVDAFLTGEASERTVSFAKELGLHFYAAGHHATERYGVQALGHHLQTKFELSHEFIDIDNPI